MDLKHKILSFLILFLLFGICGCKESEQSRSGADSEMLLRADSNVLNDLRDGQSYRITKIGNQVWMAENLRYESSESLCLENKNVNCKKYGRLYKHADAMNICPDGWHLPSSEEYGVLFGVVGDHRSLLSKNGWDMYGGNDAYNFSLLPAGIKKNHGGYLGEGTLTKLWTSSYYKRNKDYVRLYITNDGWEWQGTSKLNLNGKDYALSVRCIKDVLLDSQENVQKEIQIVKDSRDGKTYRIVKIGNQIWMAENLNYEVEESFCYEDKKDNCEKFGRLYSWDAAMKACPENWHIPSRLEFNDLIRIAEIGRGVNSGGAMLKSQQGWFDNKGGFWEDDQRSGNGLDAFGFSALPAGYIQLFEEEYYKKGESAHFWSSSENSWDEGYFLELGTGAKAYIKASKEIYGFSVRCVKD